MRVLTLLLVVCASLSATAARAAVMHDLYHAQVLVPDKTEKARKTAFREGLEQVLVKVAGQTSVLDRDALRSLLAEPQRSVQEFSYTPVDEMEETGDDSEARYRLAVTYAAARIDRQLEAADVSAWGEYRPGVLVWLSINDRNGRRIVGSDDDSAVTRALAHAARRRALPIQLPRMDARDHARVSAGDLIRGAFARVQAASRRYRPDILLVGHIRQRAGGRWRGQWTLLGVDGRRAWGGATAALGDAVAAGIDGATDRIARMLAGRSGGPRNLRVRIEGVSGLADYAQVSQYLDGLGRVEHFTLTGVEPHALEFDLAIHGNVADFERAVRLGNMLEKMQQPTTRYPGPSANAVAGGGAGTTAGRTAANGGEIDASAALAELVAKPSVKHRALAPDVTFRLLD